MTFIISIKYNDGKIHVYPLVADTEKMARHTAEQLVGKHGVVVNVFEPKG